MRQTKLIFKRYLKVIWGLVALNAYFSTNNHRLINLNHVRIHENKSTVVDTDKGIKLFQKC